MKRKVVKKSSKSIVSLLLALVMIFTIVTPILATTNQQTKKVVATIEYIDENGNSKYLLTPTSVDVTSTATALDVLSLAYQDKGTITNSTLYGITVTPNGESPIREEGWGKKAWWPFVSNTKVGIKYDSFKDGDVLRLIYSQDSSTGFPTYAPPSSQGEQGKITVDKDNLIRQLASFTPELINKNPDVYNNALSLAINFSATQQDVYNTSLILEDVLNPYIYATDIDVSDTQLDLNVGESKKVIANIIPDNSDDELTWYSNDTSIAKVSENGLITALQEGTTLVTVQANESVKKNITVNVTRIKTDSITINKNSIDLIEGESETLLATVTPQNTTDKIVWSSDDESIATVKENGMVVAQSSGTTNITATSGDFKAICKVTVQQRDKSEKPTVFFRYNDGRIKYLENDEITLTYLDEGEFVLEDKTQEYDAYFECSEQLENSTSSIVHISSKGKFYPHLGERKAQVYDKNPDLWQSAKLLYEFTLKVVPSNVTELFVYLDNQQITEDDVIIMNGTQEKYLTVKGKIKGDDTLISIPNSALEGSSTDGGYIYLDNNENIISFVSLSEETQTYTINLIEDPNVKLTFKAISKQIELEDININYPKTYYIDRWNALGDQYVGITLGSDTDNYNYSIDYEPYNANVKDVIWTSHNPEIAEFQSTYGNGIVPKKAGVANFTVTSVSNPNISKDITIEFKYKYPLESAVLDKQSYQLKQYDSIELDITKTPENATNQRFIWEYSEENIVKVVDTVFREDTSNVNNPLITSHTLSALNVGTVTVTGTPIDNTNNLTPITFTVTVSENNDQVDLDFDKYVTQNITHAQEYLKNILEGNYVYGSEWNIFTLLRTGATLKASDLQNYYDSVVKELNSKGKFLPTDYFRIVITLTAMGKDPTNVEGINLIEKLYNYENLDKLTSNMMTFTLIALDTKKYEIPNDALWTRDELIQKILSFQNSENGGFGLSNSKTVSVDITAMTLQGLAPYNNDKYPEVQSAFIKALSYLQTQMTIDCGFFVEGADNGCSAAQVLTALTSANINPLDANNGFTMGSKNIVSKLNEFKLESGYTTFLGTNTPDIMASSQIGYALESYRRFVNAENSIFDLTDVSMISQEEIDSNLANEVINLINNIGAVTSDSGALIAAARNAYNALTIAQQKLVTNYDVLLKAEQDFANLTQNTDSTTQQNQNTNINSNTNQENKNNSIIAQTNDNFKSVYLIILNMFTALFIVVMVKKRNKSE